MAEAEAPAAVAVAELIPVLVVAVDSLRDEGVPAVPALPAAAPDFLLPDLAVPGVPAAPTSSPDESLSLDLRWRLGSLGSQFGRVEDIGREQERAEVHCLACPKSVQARASWRR